MMKHEFYIYENNILIGVYSDLYLDTSEYTNRLSNDDEDVKIKVARDNRDKAFLSYIVPKIETENDSYSIFRLDNLQKNN